MHKLFYSKPLFLLFKLLFFIGFSPTLFAQTAKTPTLIPYRKGNLWGYANPERKIIIKPAFERAEFFNGSWAVVKQNNKYGIINQSGEFLAPPIFESLYYGGNGIFKFYTNNRSGMLDTLGNEIKNDPNYVNPNFPHYTNIKGKANPDYTFTEIQPYKNNFAVATYRDKEGWYRKTIIDKNGKDQLPPEFEIENTITVEKRYHYLIKTSSRKKYKNHKLVGEKKTKPKYGLLNDHLEFIVPVKFRKIEEKDNFLIVWDGFNKAGLWDYKTHQKLTRRRFDKLETSGHPARAIVTVLDKQGLIDSTGKYVIPLGQHSIRLESKYGPDMQQFRGLGLQYPNLFYISENDTETAVDPFGKVLENFNYGALFTLTDSLYLVSKKNLKNYESGSDENYNYNRNPELGLMNIEGKLLVPPTYKNSQFLALNSLVILTNDSLRSYFTSSGERLADRSFTRDFILRNQYQKLPEKVTVNDLAVGNYRSCFFVHQKLEKGFKIVGNNCLYTLNSFGVVNATGKVIIPFIYNQIYPLSPTSLAVKQASLWGVKTVEGKEILPVIFDEIIKLENGNYMTGRKVDQQLQYQLRNNTGAKLTNEIFQGYPTFTGNSAWVPVKGGKVELTRSGKIINRKADIPGVYYLPAKPGIYQFTDFKSWGFIDTFGNTVIPPNYSNAKPFQEGLAPVAKAEKWGYIDKSNKVIIPFQYEMALPFSEGKAIVKTSSGFQVISKTNKVLFRLPYKDVRPFMEGMAAVYQDGYRGFINEKGKLVIPFLYQEVTDFKNGIAIYTLPNGKGLLDKTGDRITPPNYENLQFFNKNFGWVENGKWHLINRQGNPVDSVDAYTRKPIKNKPQIKFENNNLYRIKADGTQFLLGKYREVYPVSEGLIAVKTLEDLWYYVDEYGNRFYEEE